MRLFKYITLFNLLITRLNRFYTENFLILLLYYYFRLDRYYTITLA
jgi:hypothetical protein